MAAPAQVDDREARLPQLVKCARQIGNQRNRYEFKRAGSRLRKNAIERWTMPMRHHKTAGAEYGGRSQNRANVVRIGDLIEHDQWPAVGNASQLVPLRFRQRLRFECHALMHGVGTEEPVEVARRGAINLRGDRTDAFGQPAFGVFGQQQAMDAPRRVLQRRLDRMQAEEPKRPFRIVSGAPLCDVPPRRFCALRHAGAAARWRREAASLAPRLFEMVFRQGVSHDWVVCPAGMPAGWRRWAAPKAAQAGATVGPCRFSD